MGYIGLNTLAIVHSNQNTCPHGFFEPPSVTRLLLAPLGSCSLVCVRQWRHLLWLMSLATSQTLPFNSAVPGAFSEAPPRVPSGHRGQESSLLRSTAIDPRNSIERKTVSRVVCTSLFLFPVSFFFRWFSAVVFFGAAGDTHSAALQRSAVAAAEASTRRAQEDH